MALESCIARGAHIHVLLPVMVCVQIDVESLPTVVSGALEKPEATPEMCIRFLLWKNMSCLIQGWSINRVD